MESISIRERQEIEKVPTRDVQAYDYVSWHAKFSITCATRAWNLRGRCLPAPLFWTNNGLTEALGDRRLGMNPAGGFCLSNQTNTAGPISVFAVAPRRSFLASLFNSFSGLPVL